jgi:hypothetical protein
MVLPRSSFSVNGKANAQADQDNGSSLKVSGCDLFSTGVLNNASTTAGLTGSVYYVNLTPSAISTRVQAFEEIFSWYVIRKLRVHYIPNCGTGTSGSVALGIVTDAREAATIAAPTQQQILEMNPALLTPPWALSTMELKNSGSKLYECYASAESTDTKIQALLAAAFAVAAGSAITTGQLWFEYEIDFYSPVPVMTSVDRLARRLRLSKISSGETKERALPDRDDEFVVLRTSEPQQGSASSPVYQGLEKPVLRREETKAHSSARSLSLKG